MSPTYNSHKVLSALEDIDTEECRRVMSDFDDFKNRIQHEMYIQTLIDPFRDTEKIKNKDLRDEDLSKRYNGNVADIGKNLDTTPRMWKR